MYIVSHWDENCRESGSHLNLFHAMFVLDSEVALKEVFKRWTDRHEVTDKLAKEDFHYDSSLPYYWCERGDDWFLYGISDSGSHFFWKEV